MSAAAVAVKLYGCLFGHDDPLLVYRNRLNVCWFAAFNDDGAICSTVNELFYILIAAGINLISWPFPNDFSFLKHGYFIGNFADARHVMGDGHCGCAKVSHA